MAAHFGSAWSGMARADLVLEALAPGPGELGEPQVFESRFDMYEPHTVEPGPGGRVLSDLGSHWRRFCWIVDDRLG